MFHQCGAGKKKSLTDLVKIIPFPNQNLREKAKKATAKPIIKASAKSIMTKPEPKVMETPTGQLNSSSLSIKKMMEKKEEEDGGKGIDLRNMPRNSYGYDDLKMAWRKFAFAMKTDGKETFYNAMIKREPKRVGDDDYLLEVDNQVQIDYIRPTLSELLSFIRKDLKNYDIMIRLELTNNPDQEVKYQTGKDKFAALARKNPNLHTLKNTFNLDIEY